MAERACRLTTQPFRRSIKAYGPEVCLPTARRNEPESFTWPMDVTFVRIGGKWMYLFREIDSEGQTIDFHLAETRQRESANNCNHWVFGALPGLA